MSVVLPDWLIVAYRVLQVGKDLVSDAAEALFKAFHS